MTSVTVHCPRCLSAQVYRHGQNPKENDRFRCRDCQRVFQLTYSYEANKPEVKERSPKWPSTVPEFAIQPEY